VHLGGAAWEVHYHRYRRQLLLSSSRSNLHGIFHHCRLSNFQFLSFIFVVHGNYTYFLPNMYCCHLVCSFQGMPKNKSKQKSRERQNVPPLGKIPDRQRVAHLSEFYLEGSSVSIGENKYYAGSSLSDHSEHSNMRSTRENHKRKLNSQGISEPA
jgi:hypothetical protein